MRASQASRLRQIALARSTSFDTDVQTSNESNFRTAFGNGGGGIGFGSGGSFGGFGGARGGFGMANSDSFEFDD